MLKTQIISSAEDLLIAAEAWDDLWLRSDLALPTLKSKTLCAWLETFAAGRRLCAITVADGSRLIAAIPLIDFGPAGFAGVATLPNNYWSSAGNLLLDRSIDPTTIADCVIAELMRLPWSLLAFRQINANRPAWLAVRAAAQRAGMQCKKYDMYSVGTINFSGGADAYVSARSKHHRQNMRRMARRSDGAGGRRLRIYDSLEPDEVEPLLKTGFEIEDRSWKGRAGSSVLRTPRMWRHYLREARILAASKELCLVFLEHAGQAIAFEYSFLSKGRYFTPKAGFDETFARLSPEQLLCYDLYRHFADSDMPPVVDLVGPLNQAERCWATGEYPQSTLLIATRSVRGRMLSSGWRGLRALKSARKRLRRSRSGQGR